VELEVRNAGSAAVTVSLESLQYSAGKETVKLKPGQSRKIGWDTANGWYDLQVTSTEDGSFRRRLTGREEDGQEGISG